LLVDATHSAGVTNLDVGTLDPDFVVFPTYKWLLGPYGRAFLYICKRHQGAFPLNRPATGGERCVPKRTYASATADTSVVRGFDMGERDHCS
jgi:selenocysteine lyase/cysteine desulfurase